MSVLSSPRVRRGDAGEVVRDASVATSDDETRRVQLALFRANTLLAVAVSTLWACAYLVLSLPVAAALPLLYAAVASLGLLVAARTGEYRAIRHIELVLVLVVPFALAHVLGGYVPSGGVILWGLFAPLGAVLVSSRAVALRYLATYGALVAASAVAEPVIADASSPLPLAFRSASFALNTIGVAAAMFRTVSFFERQKDDANTRTEALLRDVLPPAIVSRLKHERGLIADEVAAVTVLFVDLVDFTPTSSRLGPDDTVRFLNDLFTEFDDLADRFGLEKIRTIGDAYMAVAGVPLPRADHARAGADMALAVQACLRARTYPDGSPLRCRVGLHSGGPIVAGIVGRRRLAYDTYGDAVNIASRMESLGEPDEIQVSAAMRAALEPLGYIFARRGTIDVKGVGPMETFFLRARSATLDTPDPSPRLQTHAERRGPLRA